MECFRLLFDHLAGIKHQFLSGIRDSRKAGSLWGMMRRVGGVRKTIQQSWLAKWLGLELGLLCWVLREFRKRFRREEASTLQIGSVAVHNPILLTDYLTKVGIKTVPHPPYSPDLAPCDFCLFPKLKEAVVMRQLRRWKRLWRRSLTRSHNRTSVGPSRSFWNGTSALQPEEITSKVTRVSCL